jgi:hypothetical protein
VLDDVIEVRLSGDAYLQRMVLITCTAAQKTDIAAQLWNKMRDQSDTDIPYVGDKAPKVTDSLTVNIHEIGDPDTSVINVRNTGDIYLNVGTWDAGEPSTIVSGMLGRVESFFGDVAIRITGNLSAAQNTTAVTQTLTDAETGEETAVTTEEYLPNIVAGQISIDAGGYAGTAEAPIRVEQKHASIVMGVKFEADTEKCTGSTDTDGIVYGPIGTDAETGSQTNGLLYDTLYTFDWLYVPRRCGRDERGRVHHRGNVGRSRDRQRRGNL